MTTRSAVNKRRAARSRDLRRRLRRPVRSRTPGALREGVRRRSTTPRPRRSAPGSSPGWCRQSAGRRRQLRRPGMDIASPHEQRPGRTTCSRCWTPRRSTTPEDRQRDAACPAPWRWGSSAATRSTSSTTPTPSTACGTPRRTWSELDRGVPPDLGRDARRSAPRPSKEGIAGWTYAGKYPYYLAFTLYPFIAKIGGKEVLKAIDNLEPNAWKHDAVKKAFEAYHELYAKGYVLKGTPGLDHIQSQTRVDQGQGAVHPERLLGGERGQGHHAQGLRDDRRRRPPASTAPTRCPSRPSGRRRASPSWCPSERRTSGRHGVAAHHARQAVHAELQPARLRR